MSTKYTYGQGWPVDSGIDPITYERPYPIGDDSMEWNNIITKDTNAIAGNGYMFNVKTEDVELKLPSNPHTGDTIGVLLLDGLNVASVDRNGKKIMGNTSNYTLSSPKEAFVFIYTDEDQGWRIETWLTHGAGMMTSVYDPSGIQGDVFDMDNMREGADTKIFTGDERDKVQAAATVPSTHGSGVVALFGGEDSKELEGGPSLKPRFAAIPSGSADTGIKGQEASNGSYYYKCTAANTWVRFAVETVF